MDNKDVCETASGSSPSALAGLGESMLDNIAVLPNPVKRTLWQVVKRLTTSAVGVPAALLEGKEAEIRAVTESRVQLIKASGAAIGQGLQVPPEYIDAAGIKFAERIVGKQKNIDAVVGKAIGELPKMSLLDSSENLEESSPISEDWLNTFEEEAGNMSSEYMRTVFGRLLAGEICRPGKFSRRSVKVLGQMEKGDAELFSRFSSYAIQFTEDDRIIAASLFTLDGDPTVNDLDKFGLSYRSLLTLVELGLVWVTMAGYQLIEFDASGDAVDCFHAGDRYRLVYLGKDKSEVPLRAVSASQVGVELMHLVTPTPDSLYTFALKEYLKNKSIGLEKS